MTGRQREDGQAAVELVALLPLLGLLAAGAWQLAVAGHAAWAVDAAARAAARAAATGGDARAAARAALPERLEDGLRVAADRDGGVRVGIRVPAVLGLRVLGTVSANAHFRPQR
jgi:Flp pilus assembly protein TadG